eukprot:1382118-Amphidinium_carterae.1
MRVSGKDSEKWFGYGDGAVDPPLVQALSMSSYEGMGDDIDHVLSIELPQHRLIKVNREDAKVKLCSALLGAYSKQGVGICRHTRQAKYQSVLDACLRLAALRRGNLQTPFT